MNHLKFEVKEYPTEFIHTMYGIYNWDMKSFQYIAEWNDNKNPSKIRAEKKCNELNEQHLNSL